MSYCYSPIVRCEAEHTMVLTNQTQRECSLEHGCQQGRDCPLGGCFAKISEAYRSPGVWEMLH